MWYLGSTFGKIQYWSTNMYENLHKKSIQPQGCWFKQDLGKEKSWLYRSKNRGNILPIKNKSILDSF